jgi:hypothetical protein
MAFIGSSYFNEELVDKDVDLEMPNFFLGKKSKIVDKITSKLEVLKSDGAKIVLVENNH